MQNKILFSIMLSLACTFSVNVSAQQDYYWYKESKILLERGNQEYIIYDDALLLQSDKEKIVEKGDVSYPEMANLKWGITKPNAIIEDLEHVFYRTPSYKDTEGGNIYVTHCFYVKLKQEEDIVLLQNMTKQYNVDFEQDVDLPLWYILTCRLPSVFNALELANIFYETKLFAASEPEFIGAMSIEFSYKDQWCDTWNVFVENGSVYPPYEETYRYQLAQDTVIGEHTYTAVVSKAINDALDAPHYVAAVRFTDDRKVYIYYDNAEYLLYDFNVQKGDELEVFAGINNYTTETKTYKCRVIGIEQYTCIGCPATITLHVQNNDLTQVYRETQWIEGVGDINGFLNGLNGYINIPGNAAEYLLCAYKEGVQVYTSNYGEEFGCEFNGVHTEDIDTIPLYTGDDPGSSTIDPIDPNQVVVTLNGNELNIKESSGDEINYTLVLNKNKQAPTKEQTVQANSFIHSVSIELTESGYYTLRLTNPNWDSSVVGHFQYINTAIEEVQSDEKCNAKILCNGHLLIRVGERLYTPTGIQIL